MLIHKTMKKNDQLQKLEKQLKLYKVALIAVLFGAVGVTMLFQSQAASNLIGDLNGDNVVNTTDLSLLLANWNKTTSTTPPPAPPPTPPTPQPGGPVLYVATS